MTSDLASFLRARLDEREAVAVAAIGPDWAVSVTPVDVPGIYGHQAVSIETMPDWDIIECNQGSLAERQAVAEHIALHDPSSVLADIAAKRALIDLAARVGEMVDGEWGCCHSAADILAGHRTDDPDDPEPLPLSCDGPKELLRILGPLAAVHAGHPDYDPAWAVR